MRVRILYPVAAFLGLAVAVPAASQTSLRQFLDEVKASNPRVFARQAAVEQAEARIPRSEAWSPPMLKATLMDVPINDLDVFSGARDKRISIEQSIPFPGKKGLASDIASAQVGIARSEERWTSIDIRASAKILYINAQALTELVSVLRSKLKLLNDMVGSVESRYAVGQARQADLLRLHIERGKLHNLILSTENEIATTLHKMNELRGKERTASLDTLVPFGETIPSFDLDSLVSMAMMRRPDLHGIQAMRTSAVADRDLATTSYWPDLTLGAGYRNSLLMGETWELMLGVSIPIAPWSSGSVSGRAQEAEAGIRTADALFAERRLAIHQEVATAYRTMTLHQKRLSRYTEDIVPDAIQSLESIRSGYLTNQTDFLSFIDSFRNLETLQMELIQERAAYLSAFFRLEKAVGLDLVPLKQEAGQ